MSPEELERRIYAHRSNLARNNYDRLARLAYWAGLPETMVNYLMVLSLYVH